MSRDEDLLEALGAAAKERDEEDEGWWEAVENEDASALPSKEAIAALRPLDDDEMDAIAGDLFGATASGGDARERPVAEPPTSAQRSEASPGAKVVSITSARRWVGSAAAVLAVAAAVLLFVRAPDDAELPRYALEVRSGEKVVRGEDVPTGDVTAYSNGAVFDFVLVPDAAVAEDVGLAVFVVGDGGTHVWDAPYQRLDGGTFRVRGTVGDQLDLAPGTWRVVFLVGPPDALSSDPASVDSTSGVQRFEALVRIR